MNHEKSQLRQHLKQLRLAMTPEEVAKKSEAIVAKLKTEIDWLTVKNLHSFWPMHELHEVDIRPLLTFLKEKYPATALYTSQKKDTAWHIVQLDGTNVAEEPRFDIIIVPMLGFDDSLHRIGYGGGYYDRLLASQPQARKFGVCYEAGYMSELPQEPHDVAMSAIITENGRFFRRG